MSSGEELRQDRAGTYHEWWSSCTHDSGIWRWCRQYPYTVSSQPGLMTYKQTHEGFNFILEQNLAETPIVWFLEPVAYYSLCVDKDPACLLFSLCLDRLRCATPVFVHAPSILASAYTISRSTFDVEYQPESHSLKSRKT